MYQRLFLGFLSFIVVFRLSSLASLEETATASTENESSTKTAFLPKLLHPLKPLNSAEIEQSSLLIKAHLATIAETLVFVSISLLEPTKAEYQEYGRSRSSDPGSQRHLGKLNRKSFSILFDRSTGEAYEATVNLDTDQVVLRTLARGVQPTLVDDDKDVAVRIARKNSELKKRLRALGFPNFDNIVFQDWTGAELEPSDKGKRIFQYYLAFRELEGDNEYAHPLNLMLVFDLIEQKLLQIIDLPLNANSSMTPISKASLPRKTANYDPDLLIKENPEFYRKDVRPLRTNIKEGPNFILKKYKVEWQKFKFRFGFNAREGLVLYDISYKDGQKRRPLIYRAALSEMLVAYGDPRHPYQFKSVFDQGELGLGPAATPLKPNAQCFKNGRLIDVIQNDGKGNPYRIKNAICIHEEDGGLLHKRTTEDGNVVAARAQILVIHFSATLNNYDYTYYWKFHQDASISFQVYLSGLLSTNLYLDRSSPYGTVVSPGVFAQTHQHLFNVRIDPMFDGEENTVSTVDVELVPDSENPYGNGFTTKETLLRTSSESTDTNLETDRFWKISNPNSINRITGESVAWKLIPMNQQLLLAKPKSLVWKRAQFAAHSVWVTGYQDYELYAAGNYLVMNQGGEGLPKYAKRNESIDGKDIVLWHSFGLSHIPRLEDYPQMGSEKVGFILQPCNFFNKAPGLDVPPIATY